MLEAIEGVSQEVDAASVATDDQTAIDSSATVTTEAQATATDQTQEGVEKAETTQEAKPDESQIPESFREHTKSLEKDIREKYTPAYTGLEKTATELFGTSTPEDVQAAIQTVQALAPSIKVLTDPNATQADVVATLNKLLPEEHVEAIAWATLNDPASQDFIFSDPDVLKTISERLFDGKPIEDIQAILASAPAPEVDPEREAWRKEQSEFKAEQAKIKSEGAQRVAQEQSQQLLTRFFETPAQTVIADDFKLVAPEGASEADKQLFADTAEDIRYAAQGRFLKANMDAYMQIDSLYRQGKAIQAQAAEIRLQNRYHATLIKTAERHANLLKSRSVATVNGQQAKINGVRPDVTGSVEGNGDQKEKPFDLDSPTFAADFARSVNPRFHN